MKNLIRGLIAVVIALLIAKFNKLTGGESTLLYFAVLGVMQQMAILDKLEEEK